MKRTVISAIVAWVLMGTFASVASALPVFARQTGMPCSACHFQHFPMLNGFGRAFKSAGYTMIGSQAKVEGDSLSIPNSLNMAVMTTAGYEKTNQVTGVSPQKTTGDGAIYVPGTGGELSLFYGGRVSESAGFLAEIAMGGSITATNTAHNSAKLPILFDSANLPDGARIGFVPFSTDDHGASYGFEVLNTGANVVHQMVGAPGQNGAHSATFSAQQYIGTAGPATGVAFVANSPRGFINLTKYDQTGIARGTSAALGSTYLRVAGMFDLVGWDAGAGIQVWSGRSAAVVYSTTAFGYAYTDTKATAFDGQLQGKLGDKPVGFYISYATAPGGNNSYNRDAGAPIVQSGGGGPSFTGTTVYGTATAVPVNNLYGTGTKSSLNIAAEVGVIPDRFTLGAAIRFGRSGVASATSSNANDNAIMLGATYKLAQNMMASFAVTSASGDYWDAKHQNALGSGTTTLNLTTLF